MRPVPVVFLRFAFSPHSYFLVFAAGKPQFEQVLFWICHDRLPHLLQIVWDLLWRLPKLLVPFAVVSVSYCQEAIAFDILRLDWRAMNAIGGGLVLIATVQLGHSVSKVPTEDFQWL